jgi:nicotinamide-nucleotide amidase
LIATLEFGQPMQHKQCFLSLLQEKEVAPFLKEIATQEVKITVHPCIGTLRIAFESRQSVDPWIERVAQRFSDYFIGDMAIEEAVHLAMIKEKKTLGLAESCTGGSIAARLTALPGASAFFAGSIVAYSNEWKERFLGLKRDLLLRHGAVSIETVREMASSLLAETNIDYAIAVSGVAGPGGGSPNIPVGTVYIALGERGGKIDAGRIVTHLDRADSIELTLQTALGALWRRVVHHRFTLS